MTLLISILDISLRDILSLSTIINQTIFNLKLQITSAHGSLGLFVTQTISSGLTFYLQSKTVSTMSVMQYQKENYM